MNEISLRQLEANVALELKRISNNLARIEAPLEIAERRRRRRGAKRAHRGQRTLAEGLSSQLEFRTAESSFLETKGALLSAAYQQNVARAEWDRATGRYFQFSETTRETCISWSR